MSRPTVRGRRPGREDGTTLVELLVAVSVFGAVVGVFMAAVVLMTGDVGRVQDRADAGDDLRRAYQRLDKQVRYADAVTVPGSSGATWYVELATSAATAGAVATCTQWRVDPATGLLQTRSWVDAPTTASGTPWSTVATRVRVSAAGPPFAWSAADGTQPRQRLVVDLQAGRGAGARTTTTFVARNSSPSSVTNAGGPACTQLGRP